MQFNMQYIHIKTDHCSSAYFTEHICKNHVGLLRRYSSSWFMSMYTDGNRFDGEQGMLTVFFFIDIIKEKKQDMLPSSWFHMQNFWTLVDNVEDMQ